MAELMANILDRARGTAGDPAGQLQIPTPSSANAPGTQAPHTHAGDISGRLHFGWCQHPAPLTPLPASSTGH